MSSSDHLSEMRFAEPGETLPPLDGAPQSADDSLFLSTPELARLMERLHDYRNLNSRGRRRLVESLAQAAFASSEAVVEEMNTACALLTSTDATQDSIQKQAAGLVERLADRSEQHETNRAFDRAMSELASVSETGAEIAEVTRSSPYGETEARQYWRKQFDRLVEDPKSIGQIFCELQELKPRAREIADELEPLVSSYEKNLGEALLMKRPTPEQRALTPEQARSWLKNYTADDPRLVAITEKVLTRMVEGCRDPNELIGFVYGLFLAAAEIDTTEAKQKAIDIGLLRSPVINPESRQAQWFFYALIVGDQSAVRQRIEISAAATYWGQVQKDDLKTTADPTAVNRVLDLTDQASARRAIAANPEGDELTQFLESEASTRHLAHLYTGKLTVDKIHGPNGVLGEIPWETYFHYFVREVGPLRQLLNDCLKEQMVDGAVICTPGFEAAFPEISNNRESVISLIQAGLRHHPDSERLTEPRYWDTLTLLTPELSPGQLERLAAATEVAKQDIRDHGEYFLSKRGDLIQVTDPELLGLGFRSVLFRKNPQNLREAIVTVRVEQQDYQLLIDDDLQFRQLGSGEALALPESGRFIEYVITSHLQALRCREEAVRVTSSKPKRLDGDKKKVGRRAHKARVKIGDYPSEKMLDLAWKEQHCDLRAENRQRAQQGLRIRTYRPEVEEPIDSAGHNPVVSRTPTANDRLRRVLRRDEEPPTPGVTYG